MVSSIYLPISAVDLSNFLDQAVWRMGRTRTKITGLVCQKRLDLRRRVDLDSWKDITVAVGYGGSHHSSHFLRVSRCR